jgi:hypothetical protein
VVVSRPRDAGEAVVVGGGAPAGRPPPAGPPLPPPRRAALLPAPPRRAAPHPAGPTALRGPRQGRLPLHRPRGGAARLPLGHLLPRKRLPLLLIDASVLLFVGRVQPPVPLLCSESLIAFVFRQNGEEGKFSVYVHSAPGFQLDRTTTRSPYFYGRQLARSIKVAPPLIIFYDAEFFFSRGVLLPALVVLGLSELGKYGYVLCRWGGVRRPWSRQRGCCSPQRFRIQPTNALFCSQIGVVLSPMPLVCHLHNLVRT